MQNWFECVYMFVCLCNYKFVLWSYKFCGFCLATREILSLKDCLLCWACLLVFHYAKISSFGFIENLEFLCYGASN